AIFAVSESGVLEGVLTDGDLRRWLTLTPDIDLGVPVSQVMNTACKVASVDDGPEKVKSMLSRDVVAVPLLDANRRLVGVALPRRYRCEIEGRVIDEESSTFVIAELGNNHNGDLDLALALVDAAAAAGA